jgi:acyl-CoA thioesterase
MTRHFPLEADVEFFHLRFGEQPPAARFELVEDLARPDGGLYGGTGIGASIAAMEAATGRAALWVTTQFVAQVRVGSVIELSTDVLATGRAVSQVQVTGTHEGRLLFVSVGSTAEPREGGLEGQFLVRPEVSPPESSVPMTMTMGPVPEGPSHFRGNVEYRVAEVARPGEGGPDMALWARLTRDRPTTAAGIAFVADMVPPAVARAAGVMGGGPSLDNSLRFGPVDDGLTWVLLDLRGQMAHGGHGHGSVAVWSPDGRLLATGGQTSNMTLFRGPDPRFEP